MTERPTDEYVEETREAGIQPDERLYLPGRKWHSQRTLSRIVPALLPTPTAGDGKAAGSRNLPGSKAHPGVSLTDAVRFGNSETPRLLPTPQASDDGGRLDRNPETLATGKRPSGSKVSVPLATALDGAPTSLPSGGGSGSSDGEPLGQLTIEDGSTPGSSSGCSASPTGGSTCPE